MTQNNYSSFSIHNKVVLKHGHIYVPTVYSYFGTTSAELHNYNRPEGHKPQKNISCLHKESSLSSILPNTSFPTPNPSPLTPHYLCLVSPADGQIRLQTSQNTSLAKKVRRLSTKAWLRF